ncbi:hypothetical protein SERLA73DRAFT_55110, partial [Serpula lacrymans var. lacrymans S7.3]
GNKATGPISFSTYMQLCLSHPTHGYYMRNENAVFGARGDFITSPEISQVFGELTAIWLLERWMSDARAKEQNFRLVELGPGRGTLMDDILRVVSQFPNLRQKLKSVHLVETSQSMRTLQEQKLRRVCQSNGWEIFWHDSAVDIPQGTGEYTMLVAHEFFDALPVHVLEKTQQGWHEVLIDIAQSPVDRFSVKTNPSPLLINQPSMTSLSARWKRVLSPTPTAISTLLGFASPRFNALPIGARIEVSAVTMKTARQIGEMIQEGGSALIIDYGKDNVFGDSLRVSDIRVLLVCAFKNHKIVDIFHRPGECDITANVDFAFLKDTMSDIVTTHGPIPQSTFLARLGMQLRIDALVRAAKSPERRETIEQAAKRLIDPLGMGSQYQFLGITNKMEGEKSNEGVWPFIDVNEESQNNTTTTTT